MKSLIFIMLGFITTMFLGDALAGGAVMAMAIPAVDARSVFTKKIIGVLDEDIRPDLFFKSFFPTITSMTKTVSIEVRRGTESVAVDVIRGTNGNRNTFSKSSEKIFLPPMYWEYFTLSELEVYERAMFEQSPEAFANMIEETAKYMRKQRDKIERAIELQCAQALDSGVITLKNGNNIDFKRKAASLVDINVGGDYWNTANGDPLKDIEDGCKYLRTVGKYGGQTVNMVIGGAALNGMKNNDKFSSLADIRRIDIADLAAGQKTSAGAVPQGVITAGSWNVIIWTYPGYYKAANGTMTRYLDDNKFILMPEQTDFHCAYAAVPQVMNGQMQRPQQGEYLIQDFIDERGATHESHIKSAPLAVLKAVDTVYTAKAV